MNRLNCWEFNECGRDRGDDVCPAVTASESDGINGGRMGGRICWAIAGTFCGDKVRCTFAEKIHSCLSCRFFHRVREEEETFELLLPGQRYAPPKR